MKKILCLLIAFLVLAVNLSAAPFFETTFDSNPDWESPTQSSCFEAAGCLSDPTPDNWTYYWIDEEWAPPTYEPTQQITALNYRGASGKGFTQFNESNNGTGGDGWGADGVLAYSFTDMQEVYVGAWMKLQAGWQWGTLDENIIKLLRITHYDGEGAGTPNDFFEDGTQAPAMIFDVKRGTFGWRHVTSFRCDPQATNYTCSWTETIDERWDSSAPYDDFDDTGQMGDGSWHFIEFRIKMNTYAGGGVWNEDGEYEFWWNDVLMVTKSDAKFIESGTDDTIGWNFVGLGGNALNPWTAEANFGEQSYSFDDVVMSDERITSSYVIGAATNPIVDAGPNQSVSVNQIESNGTYSLDGVRTVASCTWSNSRGGSGTCTATGGTITGTVSSLSEDDNIITYVITDSEAEEGSDTMTATYTPVVPATTTSFFSGGTMRGMTMNLKGIIKDFWTYIKVEDDNGAFNDVQIGTVLSDGRYGYDGTRYTENVPVPELLNNGGYQQFVEYSEDTSNWTGSGPWTQTVNLTSLETYTISTNVDGATIDVTAGTATIDAAAQATYGVDDQFIVSGAGTVVITTDTANAKVQLSDTLVAYPYAVNVSTGIIVVPENRSWSDEGNKAEIAGDLLNITGGKADGTNLITTNADFTEWTAGAPDDYNPVLADANNNVYEHLGGCQFVGDGTVQFRLERSLSVVAGERYELRTPTSNYVSGDLSIRIYDLTNGADILARMNQDIANNPTSILRFTAPAGCVSILIFNYVELSAVSDFVANSWNLEKTDTAQGSVTFDWEPEFSSTDVATQGNILSVDDTTPGMLSYTSTGIELYDGTNTATVTYAYLTGVEYQIEGNWGTHQTEGANKLWLVVKDSNGNIIAQSGIEDFAGTFSPSSDYSQAWEADLPQNTKNTYWYQEPR